MRHCSSPIMVENVGLLIFLRESASATAVPGAPRSSATPTQNNKPLPAREVTYVIAIPPPHMRGLELHAPPQLWRSRPLGSGRRGRRTHRCRRLARRCRLARGCRILLLPLLLLPPSRLLLLEELLPNLDGLVHFMSRSPHLLEVHIRLLPLLPNPPPLPPLGDIVCLLDDRLRPHQVVHLLRKQIIPTGGFPRHCGLGVPDPPRGYQN